MCMYTSMQNCPCTCWYYSHTCFVLFFLVCMFNGIHVQQGSATTFPGQFALLRSFLIGDVAVANPTPVPQGSGIFGDSKL